jgi:hypothetical protein
MLHIIWAGSFTELITDTFAQDIYSHMNVSGVAIDISSMHLLELALTPPATLIGSQGLCVYGYKLANNSVNDWMVQEHIDRNIYPNAIFGHTYRTPELFTACAFGSAQFIVNVTDTVADLNIDHMIAHLEGLNITTPKGSTYLRPTDHQGLAEMYIADIVNDSDPTSETYTYIIAELNQSIPAIACAPPVTTDYVPYPETMISEIISGTTIFTTIVSTSVSILRTSGFGLVVVLTGTSALIAYKKRKK